MWTKVAIAAGIVVLVAGVALVSVPDQDANGVSPISLDDDAVRRDEDATTEVDGTDDDDDDGDGDSTRGNDGTGGGNNTWKAAWSGDGDNTNGNDGTGGGAWSASHQGDGDATRGNDGTSGGDRRRRHGRQRRHRWRQQQLRREQLRRRRWWRRWSEQLRRRRWRRRRRGEQLGWRQQHLSQLSDAARSEGRPCPRPPLFHVSTCRRLPVRSARG